jgi:hypothetical protein
LCTLAVTSDFPHRLRDRKERCHSAPPRPLLLGSGQREGNSAWLGRRGTQGRNGLPGSCAHCVKQREERSRRGISRRSWAGPSAPSIKRPTKNASPSDAHGERSASGASSARSSQRGTANLLQKECGTREAVRAVAPKTRPPRTHSKPATWGVGAEGCAWYPRGGEGRVPRASLRAEACAQTKTPRRRRTRRASSFALPVSVCSPNGAARRARFRPGAVWGEIKTSFDFALPPQNPAKTRASRKDFPSPAARARRLA